jgi:hypothetical protein
VAEHSFGHYMELWDGDRLVKLFKVGEMPLPQLQEDDSA